MEERRGSRKGEGERGERGKVGRSTCLGTSRVKHRQTDARSIPSSFSIITHSSPSQLPPCSSFQLRSLPLVSFALCSFSSYFFLSFSFPPLFFPSSFFFPFSFFSFPSLSFHFLVVIFVSASSLPFPFLPYLSLPFPLISLPSIFFYSLRSLPPSSLLLLPLLTQSLFYLILNPLLGDISSFITTRTVLTLPLLQPFSHL